MDITTGDIYQFVITYKWWFAALLPFVIAIVALKMRG